MSVRENWLSYVELPKLFQYNCLCRFEKMIKIAIYLIIYFNTTVCVGSRSYNLDGVDDVSNFNTTVCVGSRYLARA